MNKKILFTAFLITLLTGCSSSGGISSVLDRAPDYKTSTVSKKIEVPPDLSDAALDNSLTVSDFAPSSVSSYNDYYGERVKRNSRGYIEVLPELYQTRVFEEQGKLPYIATKANPTIAWQIVKKYWQDNGVKLTTESTQIGIMETDWLENVGARPRTGINGLLTSLLGFLTDSDERDRYRLRFSHRNDGGTDIAIIYTKSEMKPEYEYATSKRPSGFRWELSDTEKPEVQLEMTRRIALYISGELEKNPSLLNVDNSDISPRAAPTKAVGQARVITLNNGSPALEITGDYAQSWRVLGINLDKASFEILSSNYDSGTYQVRYRPETDKKKKGLFSGLFGKDKEERPIYLIRLSDQNDKTIAVVQNKIGNPAENAEAREILEAIK